ncbi:hypothetical protein ACF0H5_001257 [Mactra antiquata]
MANHVNIANLLVVTVLFHVLSSGEKHNIKIVEEPSSYGIMNSYQGGQVAETSKLKMRIKPSNFSGPHLFERLNGKCFSKTDESYKYTFCPFSNVTQHEQSLRWNPYSGILGVWQEWEIENNTFVAMVMREGDKCGKQQRTSKVFFTCGKENKVLNVSEPSTCNYHMNFSTPYVCHKQSMLVYPTLNKDLQTEWAVLNGQLQAGEITQKGHRKYLSQLFVKAGYMLSNTTKIQMSQKAVEKEKEQTEAADGQFSDLYTCKDKYQKLKKEVDELREILASRDKDNVIEEDPHLNADYINMMDD